MALSVPFNVCDSAASFRWQRYNGVAIQSHCRGKPDDAACEADASRRQRHTTVISSKNRNVQRYCGMAFSANNLHPLSPW